MATPRSCDPRLRRAFTMIELLTVIGIIVILMGILIPVISAVRLTAQKTNTTALVSRLAAACNNYFQDFRAYPGPVPDYAVHGYNLGTGSVNGIAYDINQGCAVGGIASVLTFPNVSASSSSIDFSSSENLVLGLEGGLKPYSGAAGAGTSVNAAYDATLIPKGPFGLNQISPISYQPYYDPKAGELSDDGAGNYLSRTATDPFLLTNVTGVNNNPCRANKYIVPEFLDTFSIPRAIIYLRARPGAQYVCDEPILNGQSGSQYYSGEMTMYAPNFFGQVDPLNNGNIMWLPYGNPTGQSNEYGFTFFANPASVVGNSDTGATRSRDSFILISAGADGVYGTKDDIIYSN